MEHRRLEPGRWTAQMQSDRSVAGCGSENSAVVDRHGRGRDFASSPAAPSSSSSSAARSERETHPQERTREHGPNRDGLHREPVTGQEARDADRRETCRALDKGMRASGPVAHNRVGSLTETASRRTSARCELRVASVAALAEVASPRATVASSAKPTHAVWATEPVPVAARRYLTISSASVRPRPCAPASGSRARACRTSARGRTGRARVPSRFRRTPGTSGSACSR